MLSGERAIKEAFRTVFVTFAGTPWHTLTYGSLHLPQERWVVGRATPGPPQRQQRPVTSGRIDPARLGKGCMRRPFKSQNMYFVEAKICPCDGLQTAILNTFNRPPPRGVDFRDVHNRHPQRKSCGRGRACNATDDSEDPKTVACHPYALRCDP